MLPEAVRARLAADVLPEMPVKGRSADEERYLFAQLLSSAPSVSLSWHVYGGDGTVTPSPFVDRLRLREGVEEPGPDRPAVVVRTRSTPGRDRPTSWRCWRRRRRTRAASARCWRPRWPRDEPTPDWFRFGATRAWWPRPAPISWPRSSGRRASRSGLRGSVSPGPRRRPMTSALWVTHAEGIGTCPWRAFVQRRLGVQPMPDPLLGLPGIDGPLVGQVVHGVLEAIVVDAVEQARRTRRRSFPGTRSEFAGPLAERFERAARTGSAPGCGQGGSGADWDGAVACRPARVSFSRSNEISSGGVASLPAVLGSEVEGWATVPGVDADGCGFAPIGWTGR